jgi:hypothetical protein
MFQSASTMYQHSANLRLNFAVPSRTLLVLGGCSGAWRGLSVFGSPSLSACMRDVSVEFGGSTVERELVLSPPGAWRCGSPRRHLCVAALCRGEQRRAGMVCEGTELSDDF